MTTVGGLFGARSYYAEYTLDSANLIVGNKVGTKRWSPKSTANIILYKIKNPDHVDAFRSF
jgi:hypothetical protein